jgi:hypothetical protein
MVIDSLLLQASSRAMGEADELADDRDVGKVGGGDFARNRALLDDHHPLRQRGDEIQILLDQHDGKAGALALQRRQRVDDLVDDRWLDPFGRLVEENEPRVGAQAACQRQQLLLAARQRAAGPVEQPLEPREIGEHRIDGGDLVALRQGKAHAQIVAHRKSGKDLAALRHQTEAAPRPLMRRQPRHVLPVEFDRAFGRRQIAHQGPQKRGLAHAVVAENADKLAGLHGDRDAGEDWHRTIAGFEAGDIEQAQAAILLPR